MSREFQDTFVQHIFDLWIKPEIRMRQEKSLLPDPYSFYAAQVIMNHDLPTEVRFDEEVHAVVRGKLQKPSTKGQQIALDELESLEEIALTDIDSNAGHMTIIAHRGRWIIRFDFRYNAARSRDHIKAAREFLDAAISSLEREHLRPFVDNLFSAVELLAKATLLLHDEDMLTIKKHGVVHSKYNLWGKLGNTDARYTKLLNCLSKLRGPSRYLNKDLTLTLEEAKKMLAVAENMYIDVDTIAPKRTK